MKYLGWLALLAAIPASAGPITVTSSVLCNGMPILATAYCTSPDGFWMGSAGFSGNANGIGSNVLSGLVQVYASVSQQEAGLPTSYDITIATSGTVDVDAATGGPLRSGMAVITWFSDSDGSSGGGGSVNLNGSDPYSTYCAGTACSLGNQTVTIPFMLGEGFDLSFTGTANAWPELGPFADFSAYASFTMSLFESDGTTPVTIVGNAANIVAGVPEPAAWLLCGLGIAGLVALARRRRLVN